MTHATPRPWKVAGNAIGRAIDNTLDVVCTLPDANLDRGKANAALIVHAVNTLDEAKAALRGILADIEYIIEDGTLRREYVESNPSWQRAKAVLAKLEAAS